jgi:putative DNA methylase
MSDGKFISSDPPYYDNIGYADLSDFYYVWLRHSLREVYPNLLSTISVPKAEELVATPARHGNKNKAEAYFLEGMKQSMRTLALQARRVSPITIYYAFKQSETAKEGINSTGWGNLSRSSQQSRVSCRWHMADANRTIGRINNRLKLTRFLHYFGLPSTPL